MSRNSLRPVFEPLEPCILLSGASTPDLPELGSGIGGTIQIAFASDSDYSNANPAAGGVFRDFVNGANINRGLDSFGATYSALNFNTGQMNSGTNGMTLYDQDPTNAAPTLFSGSVSLSVDLVQAGTNGNSPGLVALFNEGTGKYGLAIVVTEAGNTDTLSVYKLGQDGKLTSGGRLSSVTLSGGISDGVWYRLTADVTLSGDALTVVGKVFNHPNPSAAMGAQVGQTLTYTGSLSKLALSASGQTGLIFGAGASTSKASLTNLTIVSSEPPPTPTPPPDYSPGSVITAQVVTTAQGLQLVVLGTDGADSITLSQTSTAVALITPAGTQNFSGSFVSLLVYGFGGNDMIRTANSTISTATIYAGDGNDQVFENGVDPATIYGGIGDDLIVTVGGGADKVYGDAGFDSYWVDNTDTIVDASVDEAAAKSVHVITAFTAPTSSTTVSLEIAGQDMVDPTASYAYTNNFVNQPLFVDGPQYNDIRQGAVGDCYYLAGLSALAQTDPIYIQQSITALGDGTYAVRFFRGAEVYYRIDAQLPTSGSSPAYAKLTRNGSELWVPLLEKAFCQFRFGQNSYNSISSGMMDEAYTAIAGAGYTWIGVTSLSADALAQRMQSELIAGHAVTAGSLGNNAPIIGNHAYDIHAVEQNLLTGVWYVTVYNPWGYDGSGSDGNSADGLVKLTAADFRARFGQIEICNM